MFFLSNDGSRLIEFGRKNKSEIEEGLGFSYIKARLEESFSGRWDIDYGLREGLWEVVVSIKR